MLTEVKKHILTFLLSDQIYFMLKYSMLVKQHKDHLSLFDLLHSSKKLIWELTSSSIGFEVKSHSIFYEINMGSV